MELLADHKLLRHEATAGFHLLENEVGDHPPVLLLALTHQAQRAVVHLNYYLQVSNCEGSPLLLFI